MKKTLLFCSMVITMTLMPQAIHAQSFWKQLGKVITGIANSPSSGNSTTSQPNYNQQHRATLQRNQSTTSQQKRLNNIICYEVPRICSIALYGDYFFYVEDNNNNVNM